MHTTQSPAAKRQAKLKQLILSEGYENLEQFLEDNAHDSVVPGICLTERCDYTTGVEPDQDKSWCECCCDNTVASGLVRAESSDAGRTSPERPGAQRRLAPQ